MKALTCVCLVLSITLGGCATHNIKKSERACRGGHLASYSDDDFAMTCQRIDKIIYEGTPQSKVIVREFAPREVSDNWGPGTYGKEIISRVKK